MVFRGDWLPLPQRARLGAANWCAATFDKAGFALRWRFHRTSKRKARGRSC